MPDLRFTEFQKKDNQYIDADEFFSLQNKGYAIPENVIVVPVSLSQSPDLFNKIVRLKQVLPNTSIDVIANVVKSKMSSTTVILNTAKLNQYFPSASGVRIIEDINNGVPLSAETAKFLIDKNIIMDESNNYDINEAWDDVLEFFGLSEKKTVRDENVLVPQSPVEQVDEIPDEQGDETQVEQGVSEPVKTKKKFKYRKTIAGKALQSLARPVAFAKNAKKKPKTVVGKLLRPVAAAKAAKDKKKKTVAGKMIKSVLRPVATAKARKAAKKAKAAADKAVNSITMQVQKNEPVSELKLSKANEAAIKEEVTAANHAIIENANEGEKVIVTDVKTGQPKELLIS